MERGARSLDSALASREVRGCVAFVQSATHESRQNRAVEIEEGRCLSARPIPVAESQRARFALDADEAVWRGLLDGSLEAVAAVLAGQVRLLRGSLFILAPHLALARELLHAARTVTTPAREDAPAPDQGS